MQSDDPCFRQRTENMWPFLIFPLQWSRVFGRFKIYLYNRQSYSDDSKFTYIVDKTIWMIPNLPM